MYRAAVSDIDASQGWVKCGHCKKVFDCKTNEINPADFVSTDESASIKDGADVPASKDAEDLVEDDSVPQISLFDESGPLEATSEARELQSEPEIPVDSRLSAKQGKNRPSQAYTPTENKLPSADKVTDSGPARKSRDAETPQLDRHSATGAPGHGNALQASWRNVKTAGHLATGIKSGAQRPPSLDKRLNFAKPRAHGFSELISARAKSWKKQKNRFKKTGVFPYSLIAVALFAVLISQIAVVNYTKLSKYRFLSAPLTAVCSIVTCNDAPAPDLSGFEILHASVRRHASIPNVMSITAKLINFSDKNKLMPTLRLDLTNDSNTIIASRTIALTENPQFADPALTELAPGQDVQLLFNIKNPQQSAHGFQLSLVSQ